MRCLTCAVSLSLSPLSPLSSSPDSGKVGFCDTEADNYVKLSAPFHPGLIWGAMLAGSWTLAILCFVLYRILGHYA